MTAPKPRVIVPDTAVKGEIFSVRAIISHDMETGLRLDENGAVIPRRIINRFACTYLETEVFSVHLHEAVSANPFFEYFLTATESGPLEFVWEEDGGRVFSLSHDLVVR
ncbi:thiosulfate oxidation carrier complex protein SoxZ [Mesorhizobium sp. L-8-3]|uniref:thiosulfate oxidation carrier complex protein SoxZ n=1 Tax=Mesorhizobium sp. L-8-3 TaxID=2744522 RepID=UPI001937E684|nr:thiosulfate oxidation carrier complex protein SoxZ [Mesorhizobium sp. L-8-3]BCH22795.1 thiosulfate oxidation carrier complex protein SoxZ [Mesorhizobium sp. L-8-3]